MKKFIALLALVSSQVFAAPQLAQVTEVQMIQESDGAYLTMKLDRQPFSETCAVYNAQDRMYMKLTGSETEISILAGQAISTIAVGIPIAIDTTGNCNLVHGLEAKDLTFVRNINFEFYQQNRVIEDISEGFVYDSPQKNNTKDSQRIYVTGGNQGTFNCDIQAYVGDEANKDGMKLVTSSKIPKSGPKKQSCAVSFDVPPNSWWYLVSAPEIDKFDFEYPDPVWTGYDVAPYSGYKEYRYKTWYGKKKYDQSLFWEGTQIFRSCKGCYTPWKEGEYTYTNYERVGKKGDTYHNKVRRKRDDSEPNGVSEYKILREVTKTAVEEPQTETAQ